MKKLIYCTFHYLEMVLFHSFRGRKKGQLQFDTCIGAKISVEYDPLCSLRKDELFQAFWKSAMLDLSWSCSCSIICTMQIEAV